MHKKIFKFKKSMNIAEHIQFEFLKSFDHFM